MSNVIIDTDTHVVEHKDLWTSRMSKKWGTAVPHVRYLTETETEYWFVGDTRIFNVAFSVIYRREDGWIERREDIFPSFPKTFDEMHPSAYDPNERAKVMDAFGIQAAALYPNLGFAGPDIYRVIDDAPVELQVEIARCYNDWVLSWAQEQPGRFIPLACIPYWDVPSAVAEIERCAEAGHRGFVTTGTPHLHDEPVLADRHWDPVWAAAQATGLPISFHAGGAGLDRHYNEERLRVEGHHAMMVRTVASSFLDAGITACDLLMSGVLPRFPDLKFILVESGIGWIPFVLETLDKHFRQYRPDRQRPEFKELPSHYFHHQVYANYWYEKLQPWHIEQIGVDNLLFETDYPHPTCLIEGEVQAAIDNGLANVDRNVRDKILWKNAARCFGLEFEGA